jgi:hypothetical protein
LHRNGIKFPELSYEELKTASLGLIRVLLHPSLNTVIDFDHCLLWSWAGEILLAGEVELFGPEAHESRELMEACIRCALAGSSLEERMGFQIHELCLHLPLVLVYLSFPLLEAIIKKAARKYVKLTGEVLQDFEAPRRDRTIRQYRVGQLCSNINHLLFLLHKEVADSDLKDSLDQVRQHLAILAPNTDPFDLIADWRNPSLHGEATFPTIGGTILTVALLIALNGIRAEYARHRDQAWERVCWEIKNSRTGVPRSPWSFYPP